MSRKAMEVNYEASEEREPFDYNTICHEKNQCETFAYLIQIRGIDENLVIELMKNEQLVTYFKRGENEDGSKYLTAKRFDFPMHDCDRNIVGMDTRQLYTKSDGSVFRGLEYGSDRKNGFVELQCGTCDSNAKALIFEATIDALSYLEMYHNILHNHRLIVTAGVNAECIKNVMNGYHIPPENVIICTDNDKAGNELYDKAVMNLGVLAENRQVPPDGRKDWNSYLCQVKGIGEELKKNPDAILREALFRNYEENHHCYISSDNSVPAVRYFEQTNRELPPVNAENIQATIDKSNETLGFYKEKIEEFSIRIKILQNLQNPEYRQALQLKYNDMIQKKQSGEELYIDNNTRQQLRTLYLLNKSENEGGSIEIMIHNTQNRISVIQSKIFDCTQQQKEICELREREVNIRHNPLLQEERAG